MVIAEFIGHENLEANPSVPARDHRVEATMHGARKLINALDNFQFGRERDILAKGTSMSGYHPGLMRLYVEYQGNVQLLRSVVHPLVIPEETPAAEGEAESSDSKEKKTVVPKKVSPTIEEISTATRRVWQILASVEEVARQPVEKEAWNVESESDWPLFGESIASMGKSAASLFSSLRNHLPRWKKSVPGSSAIAPESANN